MFTYSERHVTVCHYNDTRSTVTRWSFHNDQRHVTAFRPMSEAAHSWSYDSNNSQTLLLQTVWTKLHQNNSNLVITGLPNVCPLMHCTGLDLSTDIHSFSPPGYCAGLYVLLLFLIFPKPIIYLKIYRQIFRFGRTTCVAVDEDDRSEFFFDPPGTLSWQPHFVGFDHITDCRWHSVDGVTVW